MAIVNLNLLTATQYSISVGLLAVKLDMQNTNVFATKIFSPPDTLAHTVVRICVISDLLMRTVNATALQFSWRRRRRGGGF